MTRNQLPVTNSSSGYIFEPPQVYRTYLDLKSDVLAAIQGTKVEPKEKIRDAIVVMQENIDIFRWALDDLKRQNGIVIYGMTKEEIIKTMDEIAICKVTAEDYLISSSIPLQASPPLMANYRWERLPSVSAPIAMEKVDKFEYDSKFILYRKQASGGEITSWYNLDQIDPKSIDFFYVRWFYCLRSDANIVRMDLHTKETDEKISFYYWKDKIYSLINPRDDSLVRFRDEVIKHHDKPGEFEIILYGVEHQTSPLLTISKGKDGQWSTSRCLF